ncbi:MAG: MBL fold metallo-hydrolase [Candidatus Helarchaeota archaeon]
MQIQFLGTAGSSITAQRTNSSILIDDDLLIDMAEGTTHKLLQFGSLEKIRTILISHLHVDHFLGLFAFLWHQWLIERDSRPITIYGPPNIRNATEQILELTSSPVDAFPFKIVYNVLDPGDQILKSGFISTTRLIHPVYTLAYRLDRDRSMCYASDTAPLPRIAKLAKNCDVLIHDTSFPNQSADLAHKFFHSTPKDAAEIANQAKVKILVLFHILGLMEGKDELYLRNAQEFFDGEVIVAKDMTKIDL